MTDSMNFGPDWIRNLSSEGSTGGGSAGGVKYQLADHRYGREEMLALFDKNSKPPASLTNFKCIYSEQSLVPLALLPTTEEERGWQGRPTPLTGGPSRGRGGSLERGGRISRGRGYQYGRVSTYDVDQAEWSPRKEYNSRTTSMENWRRSKSGDQEDDGWRGVGLSRGNLHEKWNRSTSWRGEGEGDDKGSLSDRLMRAGWGDTTRAPPGKKSWDEDNLPEWANENPTDGGGSFDDKGAFHGSDDELCDQKPVKRELGLQKSTSQQLISVKSQLPPPLSTSKSTASLIKSEDSTKNAEDQCKEAVDPAPDKRNEPSTNAKRKKSISNISNRIEKPPSLEQVKPEELSNSFIIGNGPMPDLKGEDPDFERLQEDFVLKLMGDEESPKTSSNKFEVGGIQPPPNLIPPAVQDKWFYEDPQGQMQGPFSNVEMAEWYKAGYFNNQLKVRRHCDERFFLLGELIAMCGGVNPFTSCIRFPILKNDITKMPDPELLQFQYLSQLAAYKQAQARILQEPWSAITLQQQELAANRLMMQQQSVSQDLPFIQQSQATNPLMQMINQMQQANKLPNQPIVDKPPPTIPPALDPQFQIHMNNILSMQNRLPTTNMTNNLPAGFTTNLSSSLPPENLATTVPGLQTTLPLSGITPVSIGGSISIPRPTSHGSVDQITPAPDNDPISSLLKQLQQQKQQSQQIDSLWQQNQYNIPVTTSQWQTTKNEVPLSMWDVSPTKTPVPQISSSAGPEKPQQSSPQHPLTEVVSPEIKTIEFKVEKEKEVLQKDAQIVTDKKKRKEQDEKQVKKDAEEKRKQDQRKQEAEKKAAEEKRKKEEEKIKKEMEKVKKEADEKRLRELEEKRRLKEQRKAEEEARKKAEENKKSEEEKLRKEQKEIEARQLAEEKRIQQELRTAKAAPWSQSNSTLGLSLADIQRAEKEKRAQETALQLQRLQEKESQQQQQQQQQEKLAGLQLNWAKKPVEPRKVKSLAEIQAEEQERLAKQAAESRLQKEKEKELAPVINSTNTIWNGQNLSWANASATNSQWSSSGLWEETSHRHSISKPSNNFIKSNMSSSFNFTTKQSQQHQPAQKAKSGNKPKKEDAGKNATNHNNNNNNPAIDEFTNWCYSTLGNMSTDIDIPTFVTFLRDIESAFDVREYCKDYLGDSNVTHQFASNFLEKRRLFKPRNNAHKDDMCSPAPAITPSSLQHSTEFQEVKGKNKKNKKSKMLKVDSRILGFNVTSAPDRINVGDRDYGDNS